MKIMKNKDLLTDEEEQIDNLNRKILNKYINMIYVINKNNMKIEFKKV